jgi:hypothetical protein
VPKLHSGIIANSNSHTIYMQSNPKPILTHINIDEREILTRFEIDKLPNGGVV